MEFPEDLLYSESYVWVKDEGSQAVIGLTDYAQSLLKRVVYVELPKIGSKFKRGETIGVVESMKFVADIFSPITGKVMEVNWVLGNHPQFINEDPYGRGWVVKMEVEDKEELKGLLLSKMIHMGVGGWVKSKGRSRYTPHL